MPCVLSNGAVDPAIVMDEVRRLLRRSLNLDPAVPLPPEAGLFGTLPEFDSMAVVAVITALEETFGITIEDDEITADVFATVDSLAAFVGAKQAS